MGFVTEEARQAAESAENARREAIQTEIKRRTDSLEQVMPYLISRIEAEVTRKLLKAPVSEVEVAFPLDYSTGRIRDPRDYTIWRAFFFKRKDFRDYLRSRDIRAAVNAGVVEFLLTKLCSYESKVSSIEFHEFASGPGNTYLTTFMEVGFSPALT